MDDDTTPRPASLPEIQVRVTIGWLVAAAVGLTGFAFWVLSYFASHAEVERVERQIEGVDAKVQEIRTSVSQAREDLAGVRGALRSP